MLRLAADDPLALSLFDAKDLRGMRKIQRRKKGKRAGELTNEEVITMGLEGRGLDTGMVREHAFNQTVVSAETGRLRAWRFDFAWPAVKLAVEFEGVVMRQVFNEAGKKTWQAGGGHATITGLRDDCVKYNAAAMAGWTVLRYEMVMVREGHLFRDVEAVLRARGVQITPPPPTIPHQEASDL